MGKVYYSDWQQLPDALGFSRQGPDVLDEISFEDFQERLRRFHGENKGSLDQGRFCLGGGKCLCATRYYSPLVYPRSVRPGL